MSYNRGIFQSDGIHNYFESLKESLRSEISNYDQNAVISSSEEDLYNYFFQRYSIEIPKLRVDALYMEEEPKEVNIHSRQRDWFDEGMIEVVNKGLAFTICIPFEGSETVLNYQPTSYTYDMSGRNKGEIRGNEIVFKYQAQITSSEQIEASYKHDVNILEQNFRNISTDIGQFNAQIPAIIREQISIRKKQAESNKNVLGSIKIPIKRRTDLPATYSIPEIRKKPKIEITTPPKAQKPEPTLAEEEYENILTIIKDLSVSMERSPRTFSKLKEPEIRDFFLVHLNGHYQGSATGETFNGIGKTDILIRYQNINAFIAECKFWKGKKSLTDAITQLLGYVVWRDTKTAILLFHKGTDLSEVLKQIEGIIQEHPNYKSKHSLKTPSLKDETVFSYKFTNPNDRNKEFTLSILAYQITPNPEE